MRLTLNANSTLNPRFLALGVFIALFTLIVFFAPATHAASPDDVRALIQKWVETERLISEENQAWRENEIAMQDILTALGKEEKILSEKIEDTKRLSVQADKERAQLLKERSSYQEASTALSKKIEGYERQISNLIVNLPPLLQQELAPLSQKLTDSEDLSLSVRARTVISMINQIETFDNSITLVKDVRATEQGNEIEVDVLYLGLAQAFYVDGGKMLAGWGENTSEGWQWQENNDLAPAIRRAIDVYDGRMAPELVMLPLQVQNAGFK
jgi:hypothetical protein